MEFQFALCGFAHELFAPTGPADFPAPAFAVLKDFDLPHLALGGDGDDVIDILVFANHLVKNQGADDFVFLIGQPIPNAAVDPGDVGGGLDGFYLGGCEVCGVPLETVRFGKANFLRLLRREVFFGLRETRHPQPHPGEEQWQ